jgi:hypothetical protein
MADETEAPDQVEAKPRKAAPAKAGLNEAWKLLAAARPSSDADLQSWRRARAAWRAKYLGDD